MRVGNKRKKRGRKREKNPGREQQRVILGEFVGGKEGPPTLGMGTFFFNDGGEGRGIPERTIVKLRLQRIFRAMIVMGSF